MVMAHHDCPGGCWVLGGDDGGCLRTMGEKLLMLQKSGIHQLRLVGFLPLFMGSSHTSKRWFSRRISEPSTEITSQTSTTWKSAPKGVSDLGNHHVQVPCVNCGGVYPDIIPTNQNITGKIHPLVLFQASTLDFLLWKNNSGHFLVQCIFSWKLYASNNPTCRRDWLSGSSKSSPQSCLESLCWDDTHVIRLMEEILHELIGIPLYIYNVLYIQTVVFSPDFWSIKSNISQNSYWKILFTKLVRFEMYCFFFTGWQRSWHVWLNPPQKNDLHQKMSPFF